MLKSFVYLMIVTGVAIFLAFLMYTLSLNRNQYVLRSNFSFINTIFPDAPFRTVFVGDIMLDRAVAQHAKKLGAEHIFSGVEYVFRTADAVIGNLEGTISSRKSIALPGSSILRFTFDPSFAELLKQVGFTAVSLANNHSLDFGHSADTETREYLHSANILTFGSALNSRTLSTVIPLKGTSFCVVGYHDLFVPDPASTLAEIQKIRSNCSNVTVFVHWGAEYTHVPSDRQRSLARAFIDAGADLVIGAHPHVVQPIEVYKDKAIFYSLGNFVFDQNFSFATMHGLMVGVDWAHDQTRFELIPVSIRNGQVTVADGGERNTVLETLIDAYLTDDIATSIRTTGEFVVEKKD